MGKRTDHQLRADRLYNKGDKLYNRRRDQRDTTAHIADELALPPITLPGLKTYRNPLIWCSTHHEEKWYCDAVLGLHVAPPAPPVKKVPVPAPRIDTVLVHHRRNHPRVADPFYRDIMRNPGIDDHTVYDNPPTLMQLARRAR